jgi:hypothetical protein
VPGVEDGDGRTDDRNTAVGQTVYFVDVVLVTPSNPRQIDTVRGNFVGDVPESMQAFLQQVSLVSRVIVRVFDNKSERLTLFERLHKTADFGCVETDIMLKVRRGISMRLK